MHLLSHTLIAIALALLDLESINTGIYALPISDLATELPSPTNLVPNTRHDSSTLLGREIHNADYSSGGQPQNSTYGTAPSTSSNMSDASPTPYSSNSVPGKSSKTEPAKGKQAMRTKENAVGRTANDLTGKAGHGRHSADVISREISTPNNPAPLHPRTLVGRAHSHENHRCGHSSYMPMRDADKTRWIRQDARRYVEPLLDDDDARRWFDGEERADVSGDGGPWFRTLRYFDPSDVERMLAAFRLSHGIPID